MIDQISPNFAENIRESKEKDTVTQTINIYQPVQTPAETARELRKQAIRVGLAGVR